ncbi:MAG: hypothetical protein MJE77_29240 [Proteobacteria bacterium]|nr:hypothetical protein [Pseudomonadota bacterium]
MSSGPLIERPRADVRKVAVASAASPINLGVLGTSTLATLGLVLAGHPLVGVAVLGIGVLAYGALIGLDLFNPKFIRKVYELPEPGAESDADRLACATGFALRTLRSRFSGRTLTIPFAPPRPTASRSTYQPPSSRRPGLSSTT